MYGHVLSPVCNLFGVLQRNLVLRWSAFHSNQKCEE
jgi:hypothetical protein